MIGWHPRRRIGAVRGFTLLEILVVLILVALLFMLVVERLLPLRGAAEAVAVQRNIAIMRSALGQEMVERVIRQDPAELRELRGSNPMALLASPPPDYLGELDGPDPREINGGHWYYDSNTGELVYIVRWPTYFHTELPGRPRIRYRIEMEESEEGGLKRLELLSPDRYRWERMELSEFELARQEKQDR